MARFASAADIMALRPDTAQMGTKLGMNIVVTAPGDTDGVDFVSRFFGPASGVPEDPVTGSAHCTLAPYWSQELSKEVLIAEQRSARGGRLRCRVQDDRVTLSGPCSRYLLGVIEI
jgi:predicted PhzF superfamily epimerase YddE/YHI9